MRASLRAIPRGIVVAAAVFAGALLLPRPGVRAEGQAPGASEPAPASFEVASVKPNKTGEGFIRFGMQPGGRFSATNVPVRELLRFAWGMQLFQIEGGPSWVGSDRFDVTAKAEGVVAPVGPGQIGPIQMMMRALLADRFGLKYHNETKEMPVYVLTLARPDGKLGPKLTASTTDCAALFAARRGGGGGGGPPPPGPPQLPDGKPACGMRIGPGNIQAGSQPISQLAMIVSQMTSRTVIDKTGLTGNYDIELAYTPDQMPNFGGGAPPPGAPPLPVIDPNGPSLTTALQEQLGLKLDSQRGPVTMFVIDKIEQPTAD